MPHSGFSIDHTASTLARLGEGANPSLLAALRASALSVRMNLSSNCAYARVLNAQYRNTPLPARELLLSSLQTATRENGKPAFGLMSSHIDTLLEIDRVWFSSKQAELLDHGYTLESQRAWRDRATCMIVGMGYKTLSWALFLYLHTDCLLLALDCWHCRRLGLDARVIGRTTRAGHAAYEQAESALMGELQTAYPDIPVTVSAAHVWFLARGSRVESHDGLNCREEVCYV